VLHVVGATLTAAVFGAIIGWAGGALGAPFGGPGLVVLAVAALVYALGATGVARVPVPQLRRQVPDWWRTYFSPPVTAFLYGAGLGVGFLTFLATGALLVVTLAAALYGDPLVGAIMVGGFGLARGSSAVAGLGVRTPEDGPRIVDRLSDRPDGARRALVAALLATVALTALLAVPDARPATAGSLAAATTAVVFAWSAVSKLVTARRWRTTLHTYELPAGLSRVAEPGVPLAELAVALLVVAGAPAAAGVWALVLLAVFSVAVARGGRRSGGRVTCGCFGGRRDRPAAVLIVRNAAIGVPAAVAAATGVNDINWPGPPGPGEVLPLLMTVLGLTAAAGAAWAVASNARRGSA
jgi:hypothetical protein